MVILTEGVGDAATPAFQARGDTAPRENVSNWRLKRLESLRTPRRLPPYPALGPSATIIKTF
jgi:hypothetical protein